MKSIVWNIYMKMYECDPGSKDVVFVFLGEPLHSSQDLFPLPKYHPTVSCSDRVDITYSYLIWLPSLPTCQYG